MRREIEAFRPGPIKPSLTIVLLFLIFAFPFRSSAQQPTTHDLAQRVDNHYNHLKSLKAEFTESYEGLGRTRTESGTLLLQKPGRMRWDYSRPAGKLFLLDGKYAWFYSKGDPQVQRIEAKKLDDLRSPLRFLLGHTQLEKEIDRLCEVLDDDADIVHPFERHVSNLQAVVQAVNS